MAIRANNAALDYHPEAELAGNLLIPFYTSQNLSYIYICVQTSGSEVRSWLRMEGAHRSAWTTPESHTPREVRGYMHACRQTKLWAHRKLAALDVPHVALPVPPLSFDRFGHTGKWRRAVAGDQRSLGRKSIAELRIGCWRKRRLLFRREINRTPEACMVLLTRSIDYD